MRIFISSVPDELEGCQMAAVDVVRALDHEPVLRDPVPRVGLDPVTACRRQIALADAVLAIVGFRRGRVPSGDLGGDGERSWTAWEVTAAFEHGVPVVALLAGDDFSPEREGDTEAASLMSDLRGELARVGTVFDDVEAFRASTEAAVRDVGRDSWTPGISPGDLSLRRFPELELPSMPYPLLLPYGHPELMAGRDEDLADLRRTLALPVTVVGLHAASGTGKSSLLAGGLVPTLRAEGRPVAFDRHPTEPGLQTRLLADLLDSGEPVPAGPRDFVDRLLAVRRLADGATPLLIIDQFEGLLKDGGERALAELGPLLAASAQRLPGLGDTACRWLLAYRQEFHGRVVEWLQDVLREARASQSPISSCASGSRGSGMWGLDTLPHDLSGASRFADWPLRPLGTAPAGSGDGVEVASRVFLEAIEKPLRRGVFPWIFAPGHAERLARAFGEARVRRPADPLAPELQVVLAHLLQSADDPSGDHTTTVKVPDEAHELIDQALEQHLRRALDLAFPHELGSTARHERTRALLVLRELADVHGRRDEGQAADSLARALGDHGLEVLEKFSTPRTRLVLRERHGDTQVYVLAHERLAELLVQVVDEGRWGGLDIDSQLLRLRRFVVLQSRLFESGDVEQSTAMPARYFKSLAANEEVLLWTEQHREWWRAASERQRRERRRRLVRRVSAAAVILCIALVAGALAWRDNRQSKLFTHIETGLPITAFEALSEALAYPRLYDRDKLFHHLREREKPFDIFDQGLSGIPDSRRAKVLVESAELALPILFESPEHREMIASLCWALDFFAARDPELTEQAVALRNRALAPLRRLHPPPPKPDAADPDWADIPAGTFWMGAGPDEGRDKKRYKYEFPRREVTLSAFRMLTHEVTSSEYRRLVPDYEGRDDLPATMNWYEAYTYAAWIGGRLPTEAEWEYAARAGCSYKYCKRDGSEAKLDEVAWWSGNSKDPETGRFLAKTVKQLEPNPFGLWDMLGNEAEWTADNFGFYPEEKVETDPPGPLIAINAERLRQYAWNGSPRGATLYSSVRSLRGDAPDSSVPSSRKGMITFARTGGFRVVIF